MPDKKYNLALLRKMVDADSVRTLREYRYTIQRNRQGNSRYTAQGADRDSEKPRGRRSRLPPALRRGASARRIFSDRPRHEPYAADNQPHQMGDGELRTDNQMQKRLTHT